MELHQIRYFLAVNDTRNFTRAAERCSVSQPALTNAIKKLERELDGPLFHRDRSGAKLTPLGELLLPRFQRLASESASVLEIADNHRRLRNVPLRIGVLRTIGPSKIAPCLEEFRQRAPGVELEIQILPKDELISRLEEATLEVIITNASVVRRDWAVIKAIYEERYVVVLPPAHPLEERPEVSLPELVGEMALPNGVSAKLFAHEHL